MQLVRTAIDGVLLVRPEPHRDDRGFFARLSCVETFARAGVHFAPRQTSLSRNISARTLRGMHFSRAPEQKLVHCLKGRIFDVALDVRANSPTYGRWSGHELGSDQGAGLFIPAGVAHGFLTLADDSDVLYQIDIDHRPGFEAGVRWNDPAFAIRWPGEPAVISARDAAYPDVSENG